MIGIHRNLLDRSRRQAICLALLVLAACWPGAHAQDLLEPDQAFQVEARLTSPGSLEVVWRIAKDHYMYRQRFSVRPVDGGVALGVPVFPAGRMKQGESFGEMEIYESDVAFTVPVTVLATDADEFVIEATGQGCNDLVGICYPPVTRTATVQLAAGAPANQQPLLNEPSAAGDSLRALLDSGEAGQSEFLHPDEAFQFQLTAMDAETLLARFFIEPGYYLYKDKFSVVSNNPEIKVIRMQLPEGVKKTDDYFGDVHVFYEGVDAQVSLQRNAGQAQTASFTLSYQGCAEGGLCYPPIEKQVSLRLSDAAGAQSGRFRRGTSD